MSAIRKSFWPKIRHLFQKIESYLWGVELKKEESKYSGTLSLWLVNGRLVLNTQNTNYAFDDLYRIFQQALHRLPAIRDKDDKILILGLGVGSVVHILRKELQLPNPITGVEVEKPVLELGKQYFGLNEFDALQICQADAYQWIQGEVGSFSYIVVDIFHDLEVPDEVLSEAFIHHVADSLASNGTVLWNTIPTKKNEKKLKKAVSLFWIYFQKVQKWDILGNIVWVLEAPQTNQAGV